MSKRPLSHIFVLSTALLIGAGSYVVRAAGTGAEPGTVANVDMQRLYEESDARRTAIQRVQEKARTFSDNFEMTLGPMLRSKRIKRALLEADAGVPYGRVVAVLDVMNRAGVEQLGMITQPKERDAGPRR